MKMSYNPFTSNPLTTKRAQYYKFQFRVEKCLLKCTFSGATSELPNQILWQCNLGIWIFNRVDLYTHSSLRNSVHDKWF